MSAAALRLTVFAILLLVVHSAAPMSINKRQFNDNQMSLCGAHTPCGWGVYDSNTRQMDYFVRNVCQCDRQRGERCLRSSDDVSISAYVYRCVRSSSSSSASASRPTATATGNNLARSGVDSSSSSLEMNLKV